MALWRQPLFPAQRARRTHRPCARIAGGCGGRGRRLAGSRREEPSWWPSPRPPAVGPAVCASDWHSRARQIKRGGTGAKKPVGQRHPQRVSKSRQLRACGLLFHPEHPEPERVSARKRPQKARAADVYSPQLATKAGVLYHQHHLAPHAHRINSATMAPARPRLAVLSIALLAVLAASPAHARPLGEPRGDRCIWDLCVGSGLQTHSLARRIAGQGVGVGSSSPRHTLCAARAARAAPCCVV